MICIRSYAALFFLSIVLPATDVRADALIESMRLVDEAATADLEILADAPVTWRAAEQADGSLMMRLLQALPSSDLPSLLVGEGLVEMVEVSTSDTAQSRETRILIRPRRKMTYSVSAAGQRITVRLRSRGGAVDNAAADEYRIGAGDVLEIDVFGLDELDRKARVSADGTISLPLLGALHVAGLSLAEGQQRIARMLSERDLVRDPQVSIFIAEFVSQSVTIQGAVHHPGAYQLQGRQSLLDAIGQAGGMNERVGRQIFVLRQDTAGGQQKIEIETERLIVEGDPTANIALKPGDVVMIAVARTVRIYVSGAVESPGAVDFLSSDGITVLQAITAAGGPTNRANMKNTYVLRRAADGSQERIAVNVKKIQKGKEEDLPLRKNDTVVVGEWFF